MAYFSFSATNKCKENTIQQKGRMMMSKKITKIISLLLVFTFVLCAVPANALAVTNGAYIDESDQNPDNYRLDDELVDGLKAGYRYVKRYNDQFIMPESYLSIKKDNSGVEWGPTANYEKDFLKKIGIKNSMSDYEKVAKIFLYVTWSDKHFQDGSAGYFENIGVCQDLSELFVDLCGLYGIDAVTVANNGHAWVMVKVDGKWYFCDCQGGRDFLIGYNEELVGIKVKDQMHYVCVSAASFDTKDDKINWGKWDTGSGHIPSEKFFSYFPEIKKNISETAYANIPTLKPGLAKVHSERKETPEGSVITWDPVPGADFYIVFTHPTWVQDVDGVPYCIKDGATYYSGNNLYYVHSLAMNENGKYQLYPYVNNNNTPQSVAEQSRFYYVFAYNCKGETSDYIPPAENESNTVITGNFGGFYDFPMRNGAPKYLYNIWCYGSARATPAGFADKYTGKTPPKTAIVSSRFHNEYLLKPSNQYKKQHSFKYVRTLIAPVGNTKGAVLWECENCLQRKVTYPKADTAKQSRCAHTKTETVVAAPHCTENGYTRKVCSSCYKTLNETVSPKLGHLPEEKTYSVRKASIKNSSVDYCERYTCSRCNKEIEITRPAVKTVKLSQKSFNYNGKRQSPKVVLKDKSGRTLVEGRDYTVSGETSRKKVGIYTITVKGKGYYTGTKKLTYKILPRKTQLKKLKVRKKHLVVTWKKGAKDISGYQVQCSGDKHFSDSYSNTVKGRKNCKTVPLNCFSEEHPFGVSKAYIRVRTYKVVGGKKYYSKWSKVKTAKAQ